MGNGSTFERDVGQLDRGRKDDDPQKVIGDQISRNLENSL
jgi:hypothetical protein